MKKLITGDKPFSKRDPHITFHNGKYYLCAVSANNSVSIVCADSIDGLADAEAKCVYVAPPDKEYSKELWAPELHILDGKCYIYIACDDGDNHNHRMYVLENNSCDPLDTYTMHGKITDLSDKWAIDATIMNYGGKRYFIWSGWEGEINVCQNLYIAEMLSPFELAPERHLIATPEYDWEKLGAKGIVGSPFVNEGPYVFCDGGDYYLTYSGAGCWCEHYCIAVMKLVGDNPLDKNCWQKRALPVLSSNEFVKGAGHCSIVQDKNGRNIFFHAWDKDEKELKLNAVNVWHAILKIDGDNITIE